jgi:hypothetical protein
VIERRELPTFANGGFQAAALDGRSGRAQMACRHACCSWTKVACAKGFGSIARIPSGYARIDFSVGYRSKCWPQNLGGILRRLSPASSVRLPQRGRVEAHALAVGALSSCGRSVSHQRSQHLIGQTRADATDA